MKRATLYLDDTRARVIRCQTNGGQVVTGGCTIKTDARCPGANPSRTDLHGVNLSSAILDHAKRTASCLTDANFTGAKLTATGMKTAKFFNTVMPDGPVTRIGC